MMTRLERYQAMLAHKAAARALEASLKDEAAEEHQTNGGAISWRWPNAGQVYTSISHDATEITDPTALLDWVRATYPEQVFKIEQIRAAWLSGFLPTLQALLGADQPELADAPVGERYAAVDPVTGAVVPGIRLIRGGGFHTVSIKPDPEVMRRMNLAAADYAAGIAAMPGLPAKEE